MTFLLGKWLQAMKWKAAPAARNSRRAKRTRPTRIVPQVEVLEDRTVPSTLMVTNNLDTGVAGDGSLRGEIAAAQSGDTINFAPPLAGQTLTLTSGELAITQSLDIEGPGANQLTISGNNASRVFDISGSSTYVTIADLTIADGLAASTSAVGPFGNVTLGGGLLNTGAHVTLSGVALTDNQAVGTTRGYVQTNLVSDLASENAQITDPNLKDPWGIAESNSGPFSIADQNANVATAYSVTAAGVSALPSQTVAIPTTVFGKGQGPSGEVFNDTSSFLVNGTPATFIYAGLNAAIYAWNSSLGTTAQIEATTTGALYSGLDIESTASGDFLYAADPRQDRVDVFDGSFQPVNLGAGAFVDPQLPAGLAPFNVEGINRDVYVAFALPGPAHYVAPEGAGAVAVFDTRGNFIKQLISGGNLASPWGIVQAPSTFGRFGGDLLVGNFSYVAPEINAFDPVSGAYLGTLTDGSGNTLLNNGQGIWDMSFGNGGDGGLPNTLYVTTGLNAPAGVNAVQGNDGSDGLFVAIDPLPEIAEGGAVANVSGGTLTLSHDVVADNRALGAADGSAEGGGVFNQGSTLAVDHSTFTDNQAIGGNGGSGRLGGVAFGGGIANTAENNLNATLTVTHSMFSGNRAISGDGAFAGTLGQGAQGGGVSNEGGTVTVDESTFSANVALGGRRLGAALTKGVGGGIANDLGGTLTVSHSTFNDNQAVGGAGDAGLAGSNSGGGGVSNGGGSTLTVTHSTFTGNQAIGGAGGAGQAGGFGLGGGLLNDNSTQASVDDSRFTDNQAIGGVGGAGGAGGLANGGGLLNIGVSAATALTLSHSTFSGNQALGAAGGTGGAGGMGAGGGVGTGPSSGGGAPTTLTVSHSTFTDNQAIGGNGAPGRLGGLARGGGLANQSGKNFNGTLTITHSTFTDNGATGGQGGNGAAGGDGQGGGVASFGVAVGATGPAGLNLSDSELHGNRATGGAEGAGVPGGAGGNGLGGGIFIQGPAEFTVSRSTVWDNEALGGAGGSPGGAGGPGLGGALYNGSGSIGTVFNSVFILNTATGGAGGLGGNGGNGLGGGFFNDATASVTLQGSTIVNNEADGGTAGLGGSDGQGVGGGFYLMPGGVACADLWTVIVGNHATTSDDDVFGTLGSC